MSLKRPRRTSDMSKEDIVRHLLLLAKGTGDEEYAETKRRLRRGEDFWKIAFYLGAAPALVAALGGPKL
ncbi:MAG: hypothetical protein P4N59_11425 [Negativicutes bacterium]|nr:hypothetical protein [Negativicutes bacterium]